MKAFEAAAWRARVISERDGVAMNSTVPSIARRWPSLVSVVVVIFAGAIIVAAAAMTFELIQIQRSAVGVMTLSGQERQDARDAS